MIHPTLRVGAPALVAGLLGLAPSAHAADPKFTCEASALRASVLGQPIEPVVYGRGQDCKTGQATPTIKLPELLDASVLVAAGNRDSSDPLKPAALGAGGLTGLRVKLLPSIPITLPTEQIVANIEPIVVPLGPLVGLLGLPSEIKVDIREAVRALIPNGQLPQGDILSAGVISSVAAANCADGKLSLTGSSTLTGLRILGQDFGPGIDQPLQQNLNLIDTANLDLSKLDLSKVQILTPGINLGLPGVLAAVQGALTPILGALPPIQIPATVLQVKVTPNEQIKNATTLTQRALRVQASLAGQSLVDLVIGEATVSAEGACPTAPTDAAGGPVELRCTDRKLVLLDVLERGNRVYLYGAANRDFVGKRIAIKYRGQGNRTVATALVGKDGYFKTTAKLPPQNLRFTNLSRYTAVRGKERSLPLKLHRRMTVRSVRSKSGNVTITGRITRPLTVGVADIRLVRRVACGKPQLLKRFKPRKDGTFAVTVKEPKNKNAAVYRLASEVRKNFTNPKTYPTFTLPRGTRLDTR